MAWRRFRPYGFDRTSDLRLDVVIPVADADHPVLPLTVASVRRNLAHPIGAIFVVTAQDSRAAKAAEGMGCVVIDEDAVMPLHRDAIDYRVGTTDRSGWLFQQLIKLSADEFTLEDHVLVLDADTVLLRPQTFTRRGKVVLLQSGEYNPRYFSICEETLGFAPPSHVSFIAHHMVVSRWSLSELKHYIERNRQVTWWQAILEVCDFAEASCFSEYELYGNYLLHSQTRVPRRWWANLAMPRDHVGTIEELERALGARYRTVSFHHYL